MATTNFDDVNEAMQVVISSIAGPQEGESIVGYRGRLNQRLIEIVSAVGEHKRLAEQFIHNHSEEKLEPTNQFYNAVRKRFIPDHLEE